MAKKKKVERRAGQLVIIGGAEDREGGCEILREFARLAGGTALFVHDGRVVEATGPEHWDVLGLSDVPVCLGGTAGYQVANVLACIAACRARGVERGQIADALRTFRSAADNPGRTNIFRAPSAVTQTEPAEGTKPLVGVRRTRRARANSTQDRQDYNWR